MRLGAKLLMLGELESTSQTLLELADDDEPEGTVVVAEEQKQGRGRLGRGWSSPKGGLWFSVLLRPPVPPSEAPKLTLLAAVAVARALENMFGMDARLKWPNDVIVQGKKLCGILAEARCGEKLDFVILGIGINANLLLTALPEELRRTAITIREILKKPVDRHSLLRTILNELEARYGTFCASDRSGIMDEWKSLADTLGKPVRVETASGIVLGVAEDLDGDGAGDAAVILVVQSGGSGTFYYLCAVVNEEGAPVNVATLLLGDRVQIKDLFIRSGQIEIDMRVQGPGDPMAKPSLTAHRRYRLAGNRLIQQSR